MLSALAPSTKMWPSSAAAEVKAAGAAIGSKPGFGGSVSGPKVKGRWWESATEREVSVSVWWTWTRNIEAESRSSAAVATLKVRSLRECADAICTLAPCEW